MAHHGTVAGNDWQASPVPGIHIILINEKLFSDLSSYSVLTAMIGLLNSVAWQICSFVYCDA
jgi:hypothetical protein